MNENQIVDLMFQGKLLFVHFYSTLQLKDYTISLLPGKKEGINASVMGGVNVGINKYTTKEKKEASLEVIKILNSKEFQKEYIIKRLGYITSLEELYDDAEVCEYINCEMLRDIQYYFRPQASIKYYKTFSDRAISNVQKLIDGEITIDEMLEKIDDITHIYYLDAKSSVGTVIIIILVVVSCIVVGSTFLIFVPRFKPHFKFLSTDLWIIYSIGSAFIIANIFLYFGVPTLRTCAIRQQLITNAYSFLLIPLVYRLAVNFPLVNKYSTFAINNKYLCILGLYFIQIFTTVLFFIGSTYKLKEINISNENYNFYICDKDNTFGKSLVIIQIVYNIILYITLGLLIFFDWNVTETYFDLRQFSVTTIINGIMVILLIVMNFIEVNNYLIYNLLFVFINLMSVIITHTYIFIVRTIISLVEDEYDEEKEIKNMLKNNKFSSSTSTDKEKGNAVTVSVSNASSDTRGSLSKPQRSKYSSKLISIHYAKLAQNSQISKLDKESINSNSTTGNSSISTN